MRMRVLLVVAVLAVIAAGVSAVVVTRTATAGRASQAWTPTVTPLPAGVVTGELDAVTCATARACMLMGNYYSDSARNLVALVETGWSTHWAPAAAPHVTTANVPEVGGLSCPSPGYCAAAVDTQGTAGGGIIATLSHGAWTTAGLPSPLGTDRYRAVDAGGISCPAVSDCVAVGSAFSEVTTDTTWRYGLPLTGALHGGPWTTAVAPLPTDAATGASADASLNAVACPSPGWCVAVGTYTRPDGRPAGLIETLAHGTWQAATAPLPGGGASPVLRSVACPAIGSCVAVGQYDIAAAAAEDPGLLGFQSNIAGAGLIETLANRAWRPATASPPNRLASQNGWQLNSVACRASGTCVAVGSYAVNEADSGPVIDTLQAGSWTAIAAPIPADAVSVFGQHALLRSVACSPDGACVAVGGYSGARTDVFIENNRDG